MVNTRGWRLVGAIGFAAGLVLAGCGGDDGGSFDPDSHGPLAEFMGWDQEWRGGEEASEEERQQHYEVEEYIVTCMQEAGFEYTPYPFWADQDGSQRRNDAWDEVWQLRQDDPEKFAKEYGYGATTVDYGDDGYEDDWDETDDPNYEYRESLSPAALEEYEKALHGDWEEYEEQFEEGEDVEYRPGDIGGCQNEAYEEIYGWGGEDEGQFDELWEAMDKMYEAIESDSRLAEAKQAWSTCMADAGYPGLEDLWDGENQVWEKQNELYGYGEVEPESGADAAGDETLPEAIEPGDDEDGLDEDYEPIEPDPAALAELRDFELAIAWEDYQCKQETKVEQVRQEVSFEHEERFIEDNRAELEAWRDWNDERGY